jgi:hydrogenase nickel incorporation protein HypB
MCETCGCSGAWHVVGEDDHGHGHGDDHGHGHGHDHGHGHGHDHGHGHGHDHRIGPGTRAEGAASGRRGEARLEPVERAILAKNDRVAAGNRGWLRERGISALNIVGAPGSGKTTLLERTIAALGDELGVHVVQGDQATANDAERMQRAGAKTVQINTGAGCHLDAEMVQRALGSLAPPARSLLFIENVGNLVCPALFDLGEHGKVLVSSVTEGEDKPVKYPHMYRASALLLLNKIDLLGHVAFDLERHMECVRQVNPRLEVVAVSALRRDGLDRWLTWLRATHAET